MSANDTFNRLADGEYKNFMQLLNNSAGYRAFLWILDVKQLKWEQGSHHVVKETNTTTLNTVRHSGKVETTFVVTKEI